MLLFHCLLPVIATDRAHRTPYAYVVLLLPARNPTNSSICIRIANRRVPLCDPHLHFARFARDIYAISPQKPIHARFCRRTAARRPTPTLSAPSIPVSGAGERISLCSRFMWNIRLAIRQNLNVYLGFCSFMHIYTLRYCMFFSYAFAFAVPAILSPLSLRGWRSRLGAAPPLLFPSPASPPGLPFSSALVCIPFFRGRTPSFLISRSLFASCSMAHRKLFVCFSLPSAFRAFPSMIRSASSSVFD